MRFLSVFLFFLYFKLLSCETRKIPFEAKPRVYHYLNITEPKYVNINKCGYCNINRCKPKPFCYLISNKTAEIRSSGEFCASENDLISLVGKPIDATTSAQSGKRMKRRIHEKCLPSINHKEIEYCICRTFTDEASLQELEDLRKMRIWRYQNLKFHMEEKMKNPSQSIFNFFVLIFCFLKKQTPISVSMSTLLSPFYFVSSRIDRFNQDMLDRVKSSASRVASATKSPCFLRWSPVLLIIITTIFILLGATSFWLFEKDGHEMMVRNWYRNLGHERRQFAKTISSRIFNDTRNLLIIIDREQTDRVQQLLVESLKRYEDKLTITPPSRREWSWIGSFNFAYSLLLTVGNGFKAPTALGSQIFSIFYCLFGIPLFYFTLTLIVYRLVHPILKYPSLDKSRRFLLLNFVVALFILWTILIGLVIYNQIFNDFWQSMVTAFLGSMTIQTPGVNTTFTSCALMAMNFASTISVSLVILMVLIVLSLIFPADLIQGVPIVEKVESVSAPPKFQVIVDEAGESKLTHA
ncbi:unnamed protein product [Caenorhabditis angaria]|uniref:Potassium channel domain-containing protein n=1 Tax=Caenorhabditis angaria TaxID=860376 RepID=A0A9P1ICD6_9PELO|nr:unnamed protein product [Caenorhabditis angaria]